MSKDQLEKALRDHLMEQTDSAVELKEETWNKISNELFVPTSQKTFTNKRKVFTWFGLAAIIALVFFGLLTDTGQAMIQNLKDMFVPEKQQEIELEGQKEETNVQLEANEALRYIIYIDESRYKLVKGETGDRIEPKEPLGDRYPEVSMEIALKEDTTTEEVIARIKDTLIDEGMEIWVEERVTEPIEATLIGAVGEGYTNEFGKTGIQWDTPVYRYYVTDTDNGQLFVIKQTYFQEASEGHGARFDYMLESFKVVK